jgi:G:T-mismatch repair DNA endonuclease (very short patch repair protein)
MFGDFWHQGQDPQIKIDKYARYGFDCLIVWERELKERAKTELIDIIRTFNVKEHDFRNKEPIKETQNPKQLSLF